MDDHPVLIDRFGNPIRSARPPKPLSRSEVFLGVGGLAVSFIGGGEGTLVSLIPSLGYQIPTTAVVILAVQSAVFVVAGLGLAFYVLLTQMSGIRWTAERLIREGSVRIAVLSLVAIAALFAWQVIHINHLHAEMERLSTPWDLTPKQQAKLDSALNKPQMVLPTRVDELIGNTDSQIYAGRVVSILKRHGFNGPFEMGSIMTDTKGFYITTAPAPGAPALPASAAAFSQALKDANMPFQVAPNENVKRGQFGLAVGRRP